VAGAVDEIVLVDTGTATFGPVLAERLRQRTAAPVHTAIYTHGHVDHAFGLGPFLVEGQAPPTVIGHRAMRRRFERYGRTAGHNTAINNRQFAGIPKHDEIDRASAIRFEHPDHLPDVYYDDHLEIVVGGVTFELHHCRSETDDHTWVFCPDRGVLCPGDMIIWGVPNAGNPQKVQRYPWDWAAGLREMAAKHPSTLTPGHGGPVVDDPDLVQRILLETAAYLDAIVEQTLVALEDGSPPHVDIVRSVVIPDSDSPWLQPVYDEGEFIVRNVIRWFGGWWDGRPSDLKPAPRAAVAGELVALAGGPTVLLDRVDALAAEGRLAEASHLADLALEADPTDPDTCRRVAAHYEARAEGESSLMAVNIFRSAAEYARAGRPFA
jgi:glyoxylase-like metal-dependent hydrolase (beta-lactamase superfamily II)